MSRNLRIVHCLRAPVGGLFRHVVDLALEQVKLGHEVGVVYDHSHIAGQTLQQIETLRHACQLGVHGVRMSRLLHVYDIFAYRAVHRLAQEKQVQVLHGHGAKGGAYARLTAHSLSGKLKLPLSFYTPHGGSLHYSPKSLSGRVFLGAEKYLAKKTNGLIFESAYSAKLYEQVVAGGFCPVRIIPNGLRQEDFVPAHPNPEAADFLFIGELRHLKGVDLLLEALHRLTKQWPNVRLAIVGDGPDMTSFQQLSANFNLENNVTFYGRLPARQAFELGKAIVVPSRAESFPYIVLEAGAAQLPLIATNVGGIPEIIAGTRIQLIKADNVQALSQQMVAFLTEPTSFQTKAGELVQIIAQKFTVEMMASQITDFYLSIVKR